MNMMEAYMRDVRRHPVLSRDEEMELAAKYAETRDPKISQQLVAANLRLVVSIAQRHHSGRHSLLDLVQEGNEGLLRAVEKYDLRLGIRLTSYASWWIRAKILRFIVDNHFPVRVARTDAQLKAFFNLRKARKQLEASGQEATAGQLAGMLGIPERDVTAMQGSFDRVSAADVPGPAAEQPAALVERRQLAGLLGEKLRIFQDALLDDRERAIFCGRFLTDEPPRLEEIGAQHGITAARVGQVQGQIIAKLRDYLIGELGEAALAS